MPNEVKLPDVSDQDILSLAGEVTGLDATPDAKTDAKPDDAKPDADQKPADQKPAVTGEPPDDLFDGGGKQPDDAKPGEPSAETVAEVEKEFPQPEGLNVKAAEGFKSMRHKIAALQQKLQDGAATGKSAEQIQALQKQLDDYDAKIRRFSLMESPRFVEKFVTPLRQTFDRIVDIGKEYEVAADKMRALASMNAKTRETELARMGLSGAALARVMPLFDRLSEQRKDYDAAIASEKQTAEQLRRQEQDELVKVQTDGLTKAIARLRNQNHFLLAESTKNPNWTKGILEAARRIISGQATGDELAELALKAVVSDHYKNMYLRDIHAARKAGESAEEHQRRVAAARAKPSGDQSSKPAGDSKLPASVEALADSL